ncbi:MAG: DUF5675 family protein [Vicinamibacterales bacterium]
MEIRLIREPSAGGATLGALYVDDVWQCWTLEDEIRERSGEPVGAWKVRGKTAIPAGRYRIRITDSPRFGRPLPLLLDVPGFSGIRFHPGNRPTDTEGCLLPGRTRGAAFVGESRVAFESLFERMKHARDDIWITIENPPHYAAA